MNNATATRVIQKYLLNWDVQFDDSYDKDNPCRVPVPGDYEIEVDGETYDLHIFVVKDDKGNPSYTKFTIDNDDQVRDLHAYVYRIQVGGVPHKDGKKQVLGHKCDYPPCCYSDHLEPKSQAENLQDASNRHRIRNATGTNKIPHQDHVKIRERVAHGESQSAIADEYGVTRQTINGIVHGRRGGRSSSGGASRPSNRLIKVRMHPTILGKYIKYRKSEAPMSIDEALEDLEAEFNVSPPPATIGIREIILKEADKTPEHSWVVDEMLRP